MYISPMISNKMTKQNKKTVLAPAVAPHMSIDKVLQCCLQVRR